MKDQNFKEIEDLIINIFTTAQCNARCQECIYYTITQNSDIPVEKLEINNDRDIPLIKAILERHQNLPATICFYGGEPLLAYPNFIPTIEELENSGFKGRIRYMIYTNGEMITQFFDEYPDIAKRVWIYAVSIDGDETQHNRFRLGTDFNRIKKNLEFIKDRYHGNILMWSTLREEQSLLNCFEAFISLYDEGLVNHFFWHWLETTEPFKNFLEYRNNYLLDLKTILNFYIHQLEEGNIVPIAHLNELILYLITKKQRNHTACGAELPTNYDLVGGEIMACIDLPMEMGKKLKKKPESLTTLKINLGCNECSIHFYCGGRCPLQVLYGTEERTRQYCALLRQHVAVIQERISEIKKLMEKHHISLQDVYDRSAFIVRYTDVTP